MFEILTKPDFVFYKDVPPWLGENYQMFFTAALFYCYIVHNYQGVFNYSLKFPLFLWNMLLCIYSIASTYVLLPVVITKIYHRGYLESVCLFDKKNSYMVQPYGWWIFLFALSKIVELGDTAFLILRGKKVPFIHWYHHVVTLVWGYAQCIKVMYPAEWAVTMNTFIHSWMYAYYAISVYYPMKGNKILSILQISQMIHGIIITILFNMYADISYIDYIPIVIYAIYAHLFINMYKNKYQAIRNHHRD